MKNALGLESIIENWYWSLVQLLTWLLIVFLFHLYC